ncbi:MAG: hypothetical protein AAF772_14885 [Acidobacteriota bacterium]
MMKRTVLTLILALLAVFVVGCQERTDRTESGGVLLEVAFSGNEIPFRISVNNTTAVQVPEITIQSVVANANAPVSDLMTVELDTLEVVYERVDNGTRVPTPLVFDILTTVGPGSTTTLNDWVVMSLGQLRNPPLSDLLFENGGIDSETGSQVITMNLIVRVYGRTLGGINLESVPRAFTMEFVQ